MNHEEIYCYHCKKIFYINGGFRLINAKTVSCFYCEKRIDKNKSKKINDANVLKDVAEVKNGK